MTMNITASDLYTALSTDNLIAIRDMAVENLELMNKILDDRFDFVDPTEHPAIYITNEGYMVVIDTADGIEILAVEDTYSDALESASCFFTV